MIKVIYRPLKGLYQELSGSLDNSPNVDLGDASISTGTVIKETVRVVEDYSVTSESIILASATLGDVTITLPSNPKDGRIVTVKKIDSTGNNVIIATPSSETIDGETTASTIEQWTSLSFVHYDFSWFVI